jgi:hypothetical protein
MCILTAFALHSTVAAPFLSNGSGAMLVDSNGIQSALATLDRARPGG